MRLFNTLCLEITSSCNRRCPFCPVAYNTRPRERMKWPLIVKAAEELGSLKYHGRVEFYVYNEPLQDPEYLKNCLWIVRKEAPSSTLMIATNGDYIRGKEDIHRLFGWGLNQLLINCYSPGLYEKRIKWLDELGMCISKGGNVYLKVGSKKRIVKILDKSDPTTFGTGTFALANRAGNIATFRPPLEKPLERMCTKPFRLLNINWKGEALVCCQDYHGDMAMGSLLDSTLEELWDSPIMNAYREHLIARDRTLPLCRVCDCPAGTYTHNVSMPDRDAEVETDIVLELMYEKRLAERMKNPLAERATPAGFGRKGSYSGKLYYARQPPSSHEGD